MEPLPPSSNRDEIVILRRSDLAVLLDEQRRAIIAEVGQLLNPAPAKPERLLTADEMAKALGVGRTVFFKRLRQYPQLKNLQRGKHWPENAMRAAFVALK